MFAVRTCCTLLVVVFLCGTASVRAQDALQLPQSSAEAAIPALHRAELERALAAEPHLLSRSTQQALLAAMPEKMRRACTEMIRHWGEDPRNRPQWSVRVLHVERGPRSQAVLAFRCGSTSPEYTKDTDERPAVLSLDPDGLRLRFLPVAEACLECGSELYALGLSQRLTVPQGVLVELRSVWSNDNPALGVIDARGGERLHYLLLPDARLVLALDVVRWFASHDDVEGDSEGKCATFETLPAN